MNLGQGSLEQFTVTNQPTSVDAAAREGMAAGARPWAMLGEQMQSAQSLVGVAGRLLPGATSGGAIAAASGLGKV